MAKVRLFRSHVVMESGSGLRPAGEPDYLSPIERERFAADVEAELMNTKPRLRLRVRRHLEKLTGPMVARTAAWAAPLSVTERSTESRVVFFLERVAKEGLTDKQVSDHGLLGMAHDKRDADDAEGTLNAIVAELRSLERSIQRRR